MIKKLLNLTIIILGSHQLCQAYTYTVYNKTDRDIDVELTVDDRSYTGYKKWRRVAKNQIEKFEFGGVNIGACLWIVKAIRSKEFKGKVCGPRNILIFKEGNKINWKFVGNKEFDRLKAERAKQILKPLKF